MRETEPDGHTPKGIEQMSYDELIAITTYISTIQKINPDGSFGEPQPLIQNNGSPGQGQSPQAKAR